MSTDSVLSNAGTKTRRRLGMSSSISATVSFLGSAATLALQDRPPLTSRLLSGVLWVMMVLGLVAFVCALGMLFAIGVCQLLLFLPTDKAIALSVTNQARILMFTLWDYMLWAMIASTLYGFASFLWYKLEVGKSVGQFLSWTLFFIVPMALMAMKYWRTEVGEWLGHPIPHWGILAAQYYSFVWYVLIVFVAATRYRADAKERLGRTLARWSLLSLLCYIPYGYVLFVGEDKFFGPLLKDYIGDAQLICWALMPLKR